MFTVAVRAFTSRSSFGSGQASPRPDIWLAGPYRRLAVLTAFVVASALSSVGLSPPAHAAGCSRTWRRVPSPSPAHRSFDANQLSGVDALSATDAWAVGWSLHYSGGGYRTLTEHWDGVSWSVVPTPNTSLVNNYLNAVSAFGPDDVWAVGQQDNGAGDEQTLVEHWDGSTWSVDRSATVPGSLGGVLALSPTDVWASGFGLEHWDGSTWTVQPIGAGHYLKDLAGPPKDVWATGYRIVQPFGPVLTMTAHSDGSAWARHQAVDPLNGNMDDENDLNGVTSVAGEVWSAGFYANFDGGARAHTLIERWNGTRWTRAKAPNPGGPGLDNELWDVDGISATDVWAVGTIGDDGSSTNQALIEHWNGSAWRAEPSPTGGVLLGVASDVPTGHVWAIGHTARSGYQATLILEACGV